MERIGIYGGTFDPPHLGHVRVAQFALKALDLDCLYVIPSCVPPHKKLRPGTPCSQQRLEMTQLAFSGQEKIRVSDLELLRGGTSYTVDTVRQIRKQYPLAKITLLMGSDTFQTFQKWNRWQEILKMASLAVFCRGEENEQETLQAQRKAIEECGGKVTLLQNPVIPISSTQLRRLLAFQCADDFLPEQVTAYRKEKNLYQAATDYRGLSMEALEKTVVSLLKPNRVAHVLGCRDTAADLAEKWGADPVDAARAGLLHDVTKALDGPLQITLCKCYGVSLDRFSQENPKTLHALTGALVAQRIFGENQAVVDAICSHTTGKPQMNVLEKVLYVADYMEPNRNFDGVEEMRRLADTDLDGALKMGLEMTLTLLKEQGREISPASQQTYEWICNQ